MSGLRAEALMIIETKSKDIGVEFGSSNDQFLLNYSNCASSQFDFVALSEC